AMIRRVDLVREHVDRWNTELPVAPTREAEGARDAEGNLIYRPTHHPRTRKPLPVPMPYPYYLEHLATEAETDIVVGVQDFTEALDELVPSVPMSEIERYKALQSRFSQHGAGEAVTGKVADGLSG
ncbi:peroxisomal assembly protein, partial [Tieghemiomyces parasiticus]